MHRAPGLVRPADAGPGPGRLRHACFAPSRDPGVADDRARRDVRGGATTTCRPGSPCRSRTYTTGAVARSTQGRPAPLITKYADRCRVSSQTRRRAPSWGAGTPSQPEARAPPVCPAARASRRRSCTPTAPGRSTSCRGSAPVACGCTARASSTCTPGPTQTRTCARWADRVREWVAMGKEVFVLQPG